MLSISQSDLNKVTPGRVIQIIALDSLPQMNQTWDEHVVSTFDIDIAKVSIAMTKENMSPQVRFYNEAAGLAFQMKTFNFAVRVGPNFHSTFKRLTKYLKKGYRLTSLNFDAKVSPAWRAYWIDCCHSLFTHHWSSE